MRSIASIENAARRIVNGPASGRLVGNVDRLTYLKALTGRDCENVCPYGRIRDEEVKVRTAK